MCEMVLKEGGKLYNLMRSSPTPTKRLGLAAQLLLQNEKRLLRERSEVVFVAQSIIPTSVYRQDMAITLLVLLSAVVLGAQAILHDSPDSQGSRCTRRVQRELEVMRRSASGSGSRTAPAPQATLDLTGYALHQPLRSAPYDMYVTAMRVRIPGQSAWVRVERCLFDARNISVDARLLFRDMTVSGRVKLYEDAVRPAGTCSMTLRLRRAGLDFKVEPASPTGLGRLDPFGLPEVRSNTHFLDPDFVSVYSNGCPAPQVEHRSDDLAGPETIDLSREMEDVFVRGIRTLLARYMERRLQPALRDTLMVGMGYSVSYGR